MNNKKQKIIIILHLIASFASLLLFALGIIFYYTLPTKIPTNILFVVGLLFVATILISSLLCLPLKIKIRKQILFAIFCIIFRYIWIIIPFVSIAFINLIPIDDNIFMFTDAFEIISSFIPMVFTIIVVTLSRMNDKVCGIDSHDFRRLRKDIHFSLVEMILIGIALFTIGTIFRLISSFKLPLLVTYSIGVLYSVWFVIQEIPLIVKDRFMTNNVAGHIVRWYTELKGNEKNNLDHHDAKIIIKIEAYLIYMNGMKETYKKIKRK